MAFNTSDDDSQERFALGIIFALVLLVVSTVVGAVVYRSVSGAKGAPTAAATVADSAVASQGTPPALAAGADEALADVVRIAAQRGKKLGVSGFHDATGDAAVNAELAKRRAQAVQKAILAQGVQAGNVELRKPEVTQADGSNDEARRVEVIVIE